VEAVSDGLHSVSTSYW